MENIISQINEKIQLTNNSHQKIELFIKLAESYLDLGQKDIFFETLNKALSLSIKLQDLNFQGIIYNKIGLEYISLANFEKAIENFYHAQTIFSKLNDKFNEAFSLRQLGNSYNRLYLFKQAEDFYFLALAIYQDLGEEKEIGMIFNNLGTIYLKLRDCSSIKFFLKAKDYFIASNNGKNVGVVLSNISEAYLAMNNIEKAEESLLEAEKYYLDDEYLNDKIYFYHNYARLHNAKNNFKEAVKYYFKSIEIALKIKSYEDLLEIYFEMSKIYENNDDLRNSLKYLKKYNAIYKYIYNVKKMRSVESIQTKHCSILEDNQKEINLLKHSTLKKAYDELNDAYQKLQEMQKELLISEKRNTALALAISTNHEINQPLMVIKGTMELLKIKDESYFTGKNAKYFEAIIESVDKISKILNKITTLDKISFVDYTPGTKMLNLSISNKKKTNFKIETNRKRF